MHDALAEENLSFVESIEKLHRMNDPAEKKKYIEQFLSECSPYINISSAAMQVAIIIEIFSKYLQKKAITSLDFYQICQMEGSISIL